MRRMAAAILSVSALAFVFATLSSQVLVGQDEPEKKKKKDDKDGPPRKFELGKVLPPGLAKELDLSADQMKALRDLEREVKERLEKILTAEQREKAETYRPKGPPKDKDDGDAPPKKERKKDKDND